MKVNSENKELYRDSNCSAGIFEMAFKRILGLLCVAFLAVPSGVNAQTYPNKAVRFIVPGVPGGATDILARIIAEKLTKAWGQTVIVDNRVGASGIIGTKIAAMAAPDGYTFMMGLVTTHASNVIVYQKKLPYDPVRDFSPITLVAVSPHVLMVPPSSAAHSVNDLISLAKARPGQLTYASAGVGQLQHLVAELFLSRAGIEMLHVPYKGSTFAMADLSAGRVSMMVNNLLASLAYIQSGRLRALGVTSLERSSVLPDVPTLSESGLPGFETTAWYAVFAPAGVSQKIVLQLNRDIVRIIAQPDVREQITRLAANPVSSSPEELATFVKTEIAKIAKIAKIAQPKY